MKNLLQILIIVSLLFLSLCTEPTATEEAEDDFTAPAIPTGLSVDEDVSFEDAIKITWNENTENDLDGYNLYLSTTSATEGFQLLMEFDDDETEYTKIGLSYDTTYYYKLSAFDKSGNESAMSEVLEYSPYNIYIPAIPSNLIVYGYNLPNLEPFKPFIEIRWDANSESDFSHYQIYRHTNASFGADAEYLLTLCEETTYIDTAIDLSTKYYYRITAVDKGNKISGPTQHKSDLALPIVILNTPAANETVSDLRPTFNWERLEGAEKYEIVIKDNYDGEVIWQETIAQPTSGISVEIQYPSSPDLVTGTDYFWKVLSYSSDNSVSNSSSILRKFHTPN